MEIMVNAQSRVVEESLTLAQLIAQLGLAEGPVAAEVNKTLVPKREHTTCALKAGDQIELVTLVGGG